MRCDPLRLPQRRRNHRNDLFRSRHALKHFLGPAEQPNPLRERCLGPILDAPGRRLPELFPLRDNGREFFLDLIGSPGHHAAQLFGALIIGRMATQGKRGSTKEVAEEVLLVNGEIFGEENSLF